MCLTRRRQVVDFFLETQTETLARRDLAGYLVGGVTRDARQSCLICLVAKMRQFNRMIEYLHSPDLVGEVTGCYFSCDLLEIRLHPFQGYLIAFCFNSYFPIG